MGCLPHKVPQKAETVIQVAISIAGLTAMMAATLKDCGVKMPTVDLSEVNSRYTKPVDQLYAISIISCCAHLSQMREAKLSYTQLGVKLMAFAAYHDDEDHFRRAGHGAAVPDMEAFIAAMLREDGEAHLQPGLAPLSGADKPAAVEMAPA